MKKALIVSLCFIFAGLALVNGTFALPDLDLDKVFADLSNILGFESGKPEAGTVDVELISNDTPQNLFSGGSATRSFHVKNEGTDNVYFRLVYAVQYDAGSWNKLHISFAADNKFTEENIGEGGWKTIYIGNTPYKMKVFTYKEALASKQDSPSVTITIAMDKEVTSEQIANYRSDFLQTQVLAIETEAFIQKEKNITAAEALNLALPLGTLNPF